MELKEEKHTLYLETTIPSYYTARTSRDLIVAARQAVTAEWLTKESHKYDIYASQFVLDEAAEGDSEAAEKRLNFLLPFPLLEITDEVILLTEIILNTRLFPEKAVRDVSHIAVTSAHGIEYLLTWNCNHINNANIKERLRKIFEDKGLYFPIICTPEELAEDEDENRPYFERNTSDQRNSLTEI